MRVALLTCLFLSTAATATAGELEDYIDHVRKVRMSATAEMQLLTTAGLLAGQSQLTYNPGDAPGQYWPTLTSLTCPNPEADPEFVRQEGEKNRAILDQLVLDLQPLADQDASGFVTDAEGSAFRRQVETAYLAHQLAADGEVTLEELATALGIAPDVVRERLREYELAYPRLEELGLAWTPPGIGLPPVVELSG